MTDASNSRVFNFSAGPAVLPLEVLEQAQQELLSWGGSGMSVMEVSHRSPEFVALAQRSEETLRRLMKIPDTHKVLFLQGGATQQFALAPMNFAAGGARVDYVNTGSWSKKAIGEARKLADVNVAADAADSKYTTIPERSTWQCDASAAYLHYTPNETIGGVEFHFIPDTGDVPLIADMSSTILSRPVDVSRFGMIYAGAQKNIGPAGLTLAIIREDLLERVPADLPLLLNYREIAGGGSMLNTPPTFAWYVASLVFDWIEKSGGLEGMATRNYRKAARLYNAIDASAFYSNPVDEDCRSWMNVPFTLADPELDKVFLAEASEAGLKNLKGHRSVGGMRASIYNAMPDAGVDALIDFMGDFERRRG